MTTDQLALYERASDWTLGLVPAAAGHLDDPTFCGSWSVRDLLAHMLETQRYFVESAKGGAAAPPGQQPHFPISADPTDDFRRGRDELIETFGNDDVAQRAGSSLGIAFADQLLHGWDLAVATGQDATMPDGLAAMAYERIHGAFSEEQRKGVFEPEIPVPDDASAQERLLAYTGRDPALSGRWPRGGAG